MAGHLRIEMGYPQLRSVSPSTLVVQRAHRTKKGELQLGDKGRNDQDLEGKFRLHHDDPKLNSIPSLFPSSLKHRHTSAPIDTRKHSDEATFSTGSITSRKTTALSSVTPRHTDGSLTSREDKTPPMDPRKELTFSEEVLEKQLEGLLMDNDIHAARQSIKEAYLFKTYESTSKFSRKIDLAQLGITLSFETKESFYNFFNRFKDNETMIASEENIRETDQKQTEDESILIDDTSNIPSAEPIVSESEKQQIMNVLENSKETYLIELFKSKYSSSDIFKSEYSFKMDDERSVPRTKHSRKSNNSQIIN